MAAILIEWELGWRLGVIAGVGDAIKERKDLKRKDEDMEKKKKTWGERGGKKRVYGERS
jgi:hypothetical protein